MAVGTLPIPDWPAAGETTPSGEQLAAARIARTGNRVLEIGRINIGHLQVAEKARPFSCSTNEEKCIRFLREMGGIFCASVA